MTILPTKAGITLGRILKKAQQWAGTHASAFAPNEFQLTRFTRSHKRINTDTPIQIEWGEIKPKATCRYLELTMDAELY
ncbi:hypothetical protein P3342_009932 [Pyrenophora teres f. teres]|nr:hypothetical protein P3342_009932 [Pyrenophora teres f. teres]